MEFKQIQDLIKLVSKTNLAELSIESENFKIKLRTKEGVAAKLSPDLSQMPITVQAQQPIVHQTATPAASETNITKEVKAAGESREEEKAEDHYITIKSPMVGTFYRRAAPDKDPFVKVGDAIEEGTVLCVIEAMKLFNEIESEVKGSMIKVLAEDATPVEYDQPLFIIDPNGI